MKAKIIVSTTAFSKYLKVIIENSDISDEAEILMCLDNKCLSLPEICTDEYPIEHARSFSNSTNSLQIRIEKNRIKRLVALLKSVSEQPITIHFDTEDSWIYLSGFGI